MKLGLLATSLALLGIGVIGYAATNKLAVTSKGDSRCIMSDGLPNHDVGDFPNVGNPHQIRSQNFSFCLPKSPKRGLSAQQVQTPGVAINGVIIRPGTADYFDANSPRGHSRDRRSGWNLDGMGARETLGLDAQNAHVDHIGIYHYHGVPAALINASGDTLIGWAADGFEIHYVRTQARSSYQLKSGTRPTAPGRGYDGTYNEDFEFVMGYGNLDQCNGAMLKDRGYVYFATDVYPFYPRCLWGTDIRQIP